MKRWFAGGDYDGGRREWNGGHCDMIDGKVEKLVSALYKSTCYFVSKSQSVKETCKFVDIGI